MKKGILAVTAVLVLTCSGLALAQMDAGKGMMGEQGMGMMGGGMMKGDMMNKGGMMGGKMMGMMGECPMMKSMMERKVVVTSGGEIIVVMGNKLAKYDNDLNLVKEVELKMDMEGMQKMMDNMKSMCPMMRSMMGLEEKKEEVTAPAGAVSPDEHESHH